MKLKIIFIYLKITHFDSKSINHITIENETSMHFLIFLKALFYFSNNRISDQNGGEYDVAVIGGGIVGMATAREMKVRHSNLSFIVLEKEKEICKNGVQIIVLNC